MQNKQTNNYTSQLISYGKRAIYQISLEILREKGNLLLLLRNTMMIPIKHRFFGYQPKEVLPLM